MEDSPKRPRGRPKQHASDAERARAWRLRQKQIIEEAKTPPRPVIVEKVVEKVVERIVERPSAKTGKVKSKRADAGKLLPGLAQYSDKDRKILMTNLSRAMSTIEELARVADKVDATTEWTFLKDQFAFLGEAKEQVEIAQKNAISKLKKHEEDRKKQLQTIGEELFGKTPVRESVIAVALALIRFSREEGKTFLRRKYGKVDPHLDVYFMERSDIESWATKDVVRFVAEAKDKLPEKAWTNHYGGVIYYRPDWRDFLDFFEQL